MTNDPKVVLKEVLNSFLRQHNTEDGELSAYTDELISHLPKLYNRRQRPDMHRTPFTIRELDEVLYKLQPGKAPGVDGLPAELYRRLPLNLKRHLAARLWDIAIGKTDVPADRANLVHPLYKKGDWANPDNWRPIPCATTEAKLIWMLILKRVVPAVYQGVLPTMPGSYRVDHRWRPYLCRTPWWTGTRSASSSHPLMSRGPSRTPHTASYGTSGITWDSPSRASYKRTSPPAFTP